MTIQNRVGFLVRDANFDLININQTDEKRLEMSIDISKVNVDRQLAIGKRPPPEF